MSKVEECILSISRWLSQPHTKEYGLMALEHFEQVVEGHRPTKMTIEEVLEVLDHFSKREKISET